MLSPLGPCSSSYSYGLASQRRWSSSAHTSATSRTRSNSLSIQVASLVRSQISRGLWARSSPCLLGGSCPSARASWSCISFLLLCGWISTTMSLPSSCLCLPSSLSRRLRLRFFQLLSALWGELPLVVAFLYD